MAVKSCATIIFMNLGKKIVGVDVNYKSAVTGASEPPQTSPAVFTKPISTYIYKGESIILPKEMSVMAEVELGVIVRSKCEKVKPSEVMDLVSGYCLALDLTCTNVPGEAGAKGLPWTLAKNFGTFTPVSEFIPKELVPDPDDVRVWCSVNGEMTQDGHTSDMVLPVGQLVSLISQQMTLESNDLVLTGSPRGASQIKPGDTIQAGLDNLLTISFPVSSE